MRLRLIALLLATAAIAAATGEVEGSGDPPKAGTVDTDTRKSSGYSPDDEDAVEGSGTPPPAAPAGPASVGPAAPTAPRKGPSSPAPPPPPPDSDDESVEGSGDDKDSGSPFTTRPSLTTTTTTTTEAPAMVGPDGIAIPDVPKTMWETVAVTETPAFTTRSPVYEQPPARTPPPKEKERSTERTPTRPNTTEQPALFPFHSMLKPGIFAAVVGGTVVGLLMAILLVMFIVYRMRKRDEGSYALEEPKQRPYAGYAYTKASSTKEFYA